jgi:hypothetical protein
MVTKVKCGNKDCELFDIVVPVSNLYINHIAALDGPWPCQKCGEPMKVAARVLETYKGTGAKRMSRQMVGASSSTTHTVGKKRSRRKSVRKITLLGMGGAAPSMFKKQRSKSAGRKRVAGK